MNKKLTILREDWLHGEGPDYKHESSLFRELDQKMCCMGFDCETRGVQRSLLSSRGMPSALSGLTFDQMSKLAGLVRITEIPYSGTGYGDGPRFDVDSSEVARKLADVNDLHTIDDDEREARVKALYATIGVDVEFIGTCTTNHVEIAEWHKRRNDPDGDDDEQ